MAKHCCVMSTNFLFSKVCCHHPAMFCHVTSSKLSCQYFEFSLKLKVMGSNPGYLLKSFLYFIITASTTTDSGTTNITSNCENRPVSGTNNSSSMLEIPMKEIIIVTMMLSLWVYSILLTKRRWKQILRD